MSAINEKRFQRIVNALLLNASFIDNLGLMHGKMGIAIYFFHLARETKNQIYEDYAGELLDQVFKEINITTPVNFSSGLAGIGWGVEFLEQNKFAETGEGNILEELDTAIFQLDRKKPQLPRHYDDFYGYGLYYLCRAKSDVWNEEALLLIWNDLTALLNETLPDEVTLCPDYIISLLYFIQEIRKRDYCPSGVDEMITAIPGFVSKYINGGLNILEHQYLELLFQNLGIISSHWPQTAINQSTPEMLLELSGKAAFYAIIFPGIPLAKDSVPNYKTGILEVLEHEKVWERMLGKTNNENFYLQSCLTGYALAILNEGIILNNPVFQLTNHKTIYIFNRKSRAAEYGIGTYIKELTTCLKNKAVNVAVIHLEADQAEFTMEANDGVQNWYIPAPQNSGSSAVDYNEYFRCAVTLMRLYITNTSNLIFHLNFMRDYHLAEYLREAFACKILLVVHYMDWSFALKGDLSRMRKILAQPEEEVTDPLEKNVLKLFKEDKKLFGYVDHIVCLADYARDILCLAYGVEADRITVVNNGLADKAKSLTPEERSNLKEKYRINPDEKIILYAGRLDEIKGVSYLIKAFKMVLEHEPDCRLWIVGDGAYNPLFREAEGIWNKICFTGQLGREQLFELYHIADIGVLPSLFEPFGYVAVEMMMHGLPIVVTATSGLDEIVEDGVSGLKVRIIADDNSTEVDTDTMARKITHLLQNSGERERLGHNGRRCYLERYTDAKMCKKMLNYYKKAENKL